jgi:four helix bundle protein
MPSSAESSTVRSYRDLIVLQKSLELAEAVYIATKSIPKEEIYGLTSQMRRAAVSVASNIAEGHSRQTRGEFLQFLGMSRGSLAELQTQAILAARFDMLTPSTEKTLMDLIASIGRLQNALRTSLKSSTRPDRKSPR